MPQWSKRMKKWLLRHWIKIYVVVVGSLALFGIILYFKMTAEILAAHQ